MANDFAGYGFGLNRPPRTPEDRALGFPLSLLSTPPMQQRPVPADLFFGQDTQGQSGNPMEFMVLKQPHGTQPQSQGQMMNQQLPFGFMDPNQAEMMNWEQSRPAMGPIEAMSGMPDLYRQAAQQQYSHQPMADSFLRRFGQPMPEQQQQSPMQPDMLQALMAQGGMIDAMTNQGAQDAGTSFMQNARGGEGLAQYSGKLADQPWLDEFANAGRAGVDLPMLQGHAGPQSEAMKAGIAERRQQRLGTPVSMNDRRNAVQQKAILKSEQRGVRMGDISPNQQFLNEVGRFSGGAGGGNGDQQFIQDAALYGVDVAQNNQRARLAVSEGEANRTAQMQESQRREALQREEMGQTGILKREEMAQVAKLAEENRKHQSAMGAADTASREKVAGMETGVRTSAIGAEAEQNRQLQIAAAMADPNVFVGMPYDRKRAEVEKMFPAATAPTMPGTPAPAQPVGQTAGGPMGMRQYNLGLAVSDPSAHASGFEETFQKLLQQYPDLKPDELASLWEEKRGYDPYSAAGEIPFIPGMMYDKPDGDAYPEYASHVRMRRLNRALGYNPGEGLPLQLGMFYPPGAAWLQGMANEFWSPNQPQQPQVSKSNW